MSQPECQLDEIKNKKKTALEVMAGYGRNVEALEFYFDRNDIELLDACKDGLDTVEYDDLKAKHCCYLH